MSRPLGLGLALLAALTLASCSVLPAPRVSTFDASPASLASGSSATLRWTLAGGAPSTVAIDHGIGEVTGLSEVTVHPSATTTYALTASNGSGSDTRTATVTVEGTVAPPAITGFTAAPSDIAAGSTATLSWTVTGGAPLSLSIDHGVGDVSGAGQVGVSPTQTTVYTLTATNAGGRASATATLTVGSAPPASYTLSLDGSHGRISVNGTAHALPYSHGFTDGTSLTLKALPDSGYVFDHWSGALAGQANPTTLTVDADKSVTAAFAAAPADTQPPTVTLSSPADGASVTSSTITVTGSAGDNVAVSGVEASLNGATAQTCSGTASFTCSVGPLQAGSNTIAVTATDAAGNTGSASLSVSYSGGSQSDPFNITLDFMSSISATQRAAFESAAARWAQVITQGLPDLSVTIQAGACSGLPTSTFSGVIDDVRIGVQVAPIDGSGGILGYGGPCYTRASDGLTAYGIMQFDSADLAQLEQQGLLQATILHEMGHVLGFGTLWGSLLTGGGTTDPRFTGANAVREWQALGGAGQVPVENCLDAGGAPIQGCGSGTRDAHWREATFGHELMTGYLNGGVNPMSRVTVGSLADLGYAVDYGAADSYSLPAGVTGQSLRAATHLDFTLITPIGSLP